MGLIIAHSFQMPTGSISNYEYSGRHMDGRSENEWEGTRIIINFTKTLAVIQN